MGTSISKRKITGIWSDHVLNVTDQGAVGDGSTDDTTAIQSTINLASSGDTVVVPRGTYIVSRVDPGTTDYCILIDKSLHLYLEMGATIKLADGDVTGVTGECHVIQIDSSDVYITGYGTVDMNKDGQTDTGLGGNISNRTAIDMRGEYDNVHILDITVQNAHGDGIYLTGSPSSTTRASNLSVENIRMFNCREGILLHWADNVKFINNHLSMYNDTNAQDGIETSGCSNVLINNNYVENARGSGFDIFEQARRITLNGNIARNCGSGVALGYNIAASTGTHTGANNASTLTTTGLVAGAHVGEIIRNTTDGSEGLVTANTTTTVTATLTGGTDNDWDTGDAYEIQAIGDAVTITGNVIEDWNLNNFHGIWVYNLGGADRTVIANNVVKGAASGSTALHGIVVSTGRDITISGNILRDIISIASRGIVVSSGANNVSVLGNIVTNTTSHGIELQGDNCLVSDNKLGGENLEDVGTNNVITNNIIASISGAATGREYHANYVGGAWVA